MLPRPATDRPRVSCARPTPLPRSSPQLLVAARSDPAEAGRREPGRRFCRRWDLSPAALVSVIVVPAGPQDDGQGMRSSPLKEKALRIMSDGSSSTGRLLTLLALLARAPARMVAPVNSEPAVADEGLRYMPRWSVLSIV